jgi:hypothetical protein
MQSGSHVARVGEFREADRLLQRWMEGAPKEHTEFSFEIAFQDGFVFRCQYDFLRRTRARPSLSKLVRNAFFGRCEAIGMLPRSPERYEISSF